MLHRVLGVPLSMLPRVKASSADFGLTDRASFMGGGVQVAEIAGDQQAALFGQGCHEPCSLKNTYGTGCFLLMNTGSRVVASQHSLVSSVAWKLQDRVDYMLEGSVFIAGAVVQWLRDGPGLVEKAPDIEAEIARLRSEYGIDGDLIGVGIDRIDYTKGIPERLRAIDLVLQQRPDLARRFQFVQIGVPSRTLIGVYKQLSDEIQELIGRINWKHEQEGRRPIVYINHHCPPITMQALDRMARFCLVSPLHDGMNLVAKEFVATRFDRDGVLILSKFAGAAWELEDALLVNPYSLEEIAAAMVRAMEMPKRERGRRMRRLRDRVSKNNIYRWAGDILSELSRLESNEVE